LLGAAIVVLGVVYGVKFIAPPNPDDPLTKQGGSKGRSAGNAAEVSKLNVCKFGVLDNRGHRLDLHSRRLLN
jgi:hypothetical protein